MPNPEIKPGPELNRAGDRAKSQFTVEAPTPALAICAAILKLKEKSDA